MKIKLLLLKSAVLPTALALAGFASAQQINKPTAPAPAAKPAAKEAGQEAKKPAPRKVARKKVVEVDKAAVPPLLDRLEEHRLAVRRGEEREPTSAYLIEEITVTGTYKSVQGYGAFLRAANGRTFFAYAGMKFYDGYVAQIEPDQVVFQQILPDGKKKQIVKSYDPNALRSAAISNQAEKDKDKKEQEKKEKKKASSKKEESEDKDASDDDE